MNAPPIAWLMSGLLLAATFAGPARAGLDDPPALEGPVELMQDDGRAVAPPVPGPPHEAVADPASARTETPDRLPQAPPAPIVERPKGERPGLGAQWIEGYWAWDPSRQEYIWASGAWRIPPPGKIWVDGQWRRDARGWYRIPGTWSDRRTDRVDWRQDGPPADRPDDKVGAAPGPDYFFVAGHYVPDGDGLAWRPGFWARAQAGWDWVPARWVRQAAGWAYREGHWERDQDERGLPNDSASPFRNRILVSEPLTGPTPAADRSRPPIRRDAARPSFASPDRSTSTAGPSLDPNGPTDLLPPKDEEMVRSGNPARRPPGASPARGLLDEAKSPEGDPGPDQADDPDADRKRDPLDPASPLDPPVGLGPAVPPGPVWYGPYPPPGPGRFGPVGRPGPLRDPRFLRRGPLAPVVRPLLRQARGILGF